VVCFGLGPIASTLPWLRLWRASEIVVALSEQNTGQALYFKNSFVGLNS